MYCKKIFNNFLIAESCRTRTHLFQKLPNPTPAPESQNAPFDLYLNPTSTQFTQTPKHKLSCDCLIDYLLFSFNFELVSCILISKYHGMF